MAKKLQKFLKGFTLIELIIVIAIISVLGATAFLLLTQWMSKGRDATKISTIRTIKTALDINFTSRGEYPIPQDAVEHTSSNGTRLYQGYVGANMVAELQRTPIDPTTKKPYIYSYMKPSGSVGYYQIGTTIENTVGYQGYELAKADIVQTAKIIGNYEFDPSLPSLIIVGGNETSKGIYDPSNCYVLDGGKNTVDGAQCQPKKDMPLKDYDNGLVGYWDMESLTDDGKLMDISGNGNHGVFSGTMTTYYTGIVGGAMQFFTGGYVIQNPANFNHDNITIIVKFYTLYDMEQAPAYHNIINKRDCTVSCYATGSFWLGTSYIGGMSGSVGINMYDNYNGTLKGVTLRSEKSKFIGDKKRHELILQKSNKNKMKVYLDQNLFYDVQFTGDILSGAVPYYIGTSGHTLKYLQSVGVIDDVKIYSRVLSNTEILQQAKIAGF